MKKESDILVQPGLVEVVGSNMEPMLISSDPNSEISLETLISITAEATYNANVAAVQTGIPMYLEEAGSIYLIQPSGKKEFIKKMENSSTQLSKKFKLK
jgi:hypothetical protein